MPASSAPFPTLSASRRIVAAVVSALALVSCAGVQAPPAGGAVSAGAPPDPGFPALERDVLAELNAARTNPTAYARTVEALIPHFDGRVMRRPGQAAIATQEGAAAVREAAVALRATAPRAAVTASPGMTRGARDHVEDHGPRGALGHTGSGGSTTASRVNRYGQWQGRLTESISYGPATGADVVQGLLIDDGVPGRGHRQNLLDPGVRVAGVACGRHARYRVTCVIDLAAGYVER